MSLAKPKWNDQIAVESVGGIPYRMYTERPRRVDQLLALADQWGEQPHIIHGDRVVTFSGLRRGVAEKARDMAASGVKSGDRVLLLGWNSPDWVMNFWACIQIGAIPSLANAWWGESEINYALDLLKPVLVLADKRTEDKIPAGWKRGSWAANENAAGDVPAAPDVDAKPPGENETAVIVFTSGTEGRAKAVVLPHRALLSGLQMMMHVTHQIPLEFNPKKSERVLHTGPLFHVGGPQAMLRGITVGNTLVFLTGRFDPADVLAVIEKNKVNRWTAVPTMISRALDLPEVKTRDLRSLRAIGVGGAQVTADLLERLRTTLPHIQLRVAIGYGLTENTGPATAASGADSEKYPGTCGRPLPLVEVKIDPRPDLIDGEVLVRSPTQMSAYYGMDNSPIDKDGWLHTGDLGKVDENGRLWITGRSKDMIIRGAENIAPAAVEKALMSLPQVVECAVVGVPHPDLGEDVFAFVVLNQPATPQDLQAQLRPILASFAIPSRWHLQTEPLAINQTGKIDKAVLSAKAKSLT